ncbi:cyclic di-GMP phosphodiesterase response regulator RpfG [Andreesenia angusta]|uniref:Cyclic di-GMP phosphodiesterase response regulator RpfG n=1 Tax=Andreesenia angusta TaxID=39480 RepID=A0A1S1V6B4_9FIRM|nr:HD-GYP domain-containing protein [Andreesenia angusta]OHW61910.1 cyclic di-GMP phosphodiesterase response regulator RpfG [Andreesenia angusta]
MKLINIRKARPGDILSYNIMTETGQIMLRDGMVLSSDYIKKIKYMGINYIYIKDELLEDIAPINPELVKLKAEVVKSFNNMYNRVQNEDLSQIEGINNNVRSLVDFIVSSKDINLVYLSDLKTFDNYTFIHSLNTSLTALFIGKHMGFSRESLVEITLGSLLHDIGKTKIPKAILNKTGKLSSEEFEVMKKHPLHGHDVIFRMPSVSPMARMISLQHHERLDGTGYPNGLLDNEITMYSKIAALSDVYDALSNNRVYRNALPTDEAYDIIVKNTGIYFDPKVVEVFKREFSVYPIGTQVEVTGGMIGYVVKQNRGEQRRPVIRLAYNAIGEKLAYPIELDLKAIDGIKVEKAVV